MKNGFLFLAFTQLVSLSKTLNLVEYVKRLTVIILKKFKPFAEERDNVVARSNIGADIFVVAKWLLITCLIMFSVQHLFWKYAVFYLIWSNLFTYFYYHAWGSSFVQNSDIEAQRNRFLKFLLSIGFYLACYAYLYQFHYAAAIEWPDKQIDTINSIYLSVANAFTLTYGGFLPLNQTARVLFMTELVNTFFFFTVIVANSIPTIIARK